MQHAHEREAVAVEAAVMRQVADIVSATIREALTGALHAARVCGCRSCRAEAARTFLWAVGMAAMASDDDAA